MATNFPVEILPCCAFIDTGIGGMPYLHQLNKISPSTPCIYVADTANFPYGEKSEDEIYEAISGLIQRLLWRFPPSVAVIACNTISVTALEYLRKTFPLIQFVGTVPAIKKAAAVSKNRVIGLLATGETVKNPYTKKLISDFASDCKVISRAAPRLIRAIERRLLLADEAEQIEYVKPFVEPFVSKGADTVVLGCTHFLHLQDAFRAALGNGIQVVDSLDGVAQQALRLVKKFRSEAGIIAPEDEGGSASESEKAAPVNYFFMTGDINGQRAKTYSHCLKIYDIRWGGLI